MKQIIVLDTSVLAYDTNCLSTFENSLIILPIIVIEELDKLKKQPNEAGKNARVFTRQLDELLKGKDLAQGIQLENGSLLKIDIKSYDAIGSDKSYGDNNILACAVGNKSSEVPTILVSRDINLRIRAQAFGVQSEGYEDKSTIDNEFLYNGNRTVINKSAGKKLLETGQILCSDYDLDDMYPNECIVFTDKNGTGIASGKNVYGKIQLMNSHTPWGLGLRGKEQFFAADLIMDPKIPLVSLIGRSGTGKAQPLDAKILTSTGWTTMGEVKLGDFIPTPNGKKAQIVGIFPQGNIDIYKVSFSDNTSTECCGNHLWLTKTVRQKANRKEPTIKTTLEIKNSLLYGKANKRNHSIPMTKPIAMTENTLVLDPYAFGCLLGDGSFRYHLGFTSIDPEIIESVNKSLNKVELKLKTSSIRNVYDYHIVGLSGRVKNSKEIIALQNDQIISTYDNMSSVIKAGFSKTNTYRAIANNVKYRGFTWKYGEYKTSSLLHNFIKNENLWMKKSEEKHIPNIYKFSSAEDRIALLQGLMDTDGSIDKRGILEFSTSSYQLSLDFKWLVNSLGGIINFIPKKTTYTYKNKKKEGLISYRGVVSLPNEIIPFRVSRKFNLLKARTKYFPSRYITSVELIGKKEAQCILLNDEDHLYITNDCIVTHNTLISCASALELVLNQKKYDSFMIYRPIQAMGAELGFTPGTVQEKLEPWFAAIDDAFSFLFSDKAKKKDNWKNILHQYMDNGTISKEALTYIRGRSIPNALILIDEFQNLNKEEAKAILTRVGEGSKIILTGDIDQIDARNLDAMNNGLTYVVEAFKHSDLAGHITFTKGERSPLAEEASRIL